MYGVQMDGGLSSPQALTVDRMQLVLSLNKTMMLLPPVSVHNKNEEPWQNTQDRNTDDDGISEPTTRTID